jgi:hypothetical protein
MNNFNMIRMIPLCEKGDEWPIWSEKVSFKGKEISLLLGKLSIPKSNDNFDEVLDIGKKLASTIELNEIVLTELILFTDVKAIYGKNKFNIVKGCKSKKLF